jgi:hypothetical protein
VLSNFQKKIFLRWKSLPRRMGVLVDSLIPLGAVISDLLMDLELARFPTEGNDQIPDSELISPDTMLNTFSIPCSIIYCILARN